MKSPPAIRRILWLVWLLVGVGLTALTILLLLVGRQRGLIRSERVRLQAEQDGLHRVAQEILRGAGEGRVQIMAILQDQADGRASGAARGVAALIDQLMASPDQPFPVATLREVRRLVGQLSEVEGRALAWRMRYAPVWEDLRQRQTGRTVQDRLTDVRRLVDALAGASGLEEVKLMQRWRAAVGEERARQAEFILTDQDRKRGRGSRELIRELTGIETLATRLEFEEETDRLAELKDRQLRPALERLRYEISLFAAEQPEQEALAAQKIDALATALFGAGNVDPGSGGLYLLRWEILELRAERIALERERSDLSHGIDVAVAALVQAAAGRSEALSVETEQHLASRWWRLVLATSGCAALFLGLAWHISRSIRRQVESIEQAKAEAVSERLQALQLTQDLQKLQRDHALLLNSIGEGIHWIDAEGRIVFENPAAARMLGWETKELVGRPAHATLHHSRVDGSAFPEEECPIYETLRTGESARVDDEVFWRKDGTSFPVAYVTAPVRGEGGTVIGATVVFTDITERKRGEELLHETEERFAAVFEQAPIGMTLVTPDGHIQRVNRALCELLGYSEGELLTRTFFALVYAEDLAASHQNVRRIMAEEIAFFQTEKRYVHQSGRLITALLSVSLLRDARGQPICFIAQIQDITERKQAEAERAATQLELVAASRQAGMAEVATGVLHNVGNVLNSVNIALTVATDKIQGLKLGTLQRLSALLNEQTDLAGFFTRDPRGAELPGFLARVTGQLESSRTGALAELDGLRRHIEHINEIVAMQQDYANIAGVTEILPLADLIEDALRLNAASVERHGLHVTRDFAELPPVSADRHLILQILVNLIRNAKHALDEGAPIEKRLTLRLAREGDGAVVISVTDNGIGIPADNLTRIFEHGFTTRKDGHGFGLHSSALAAREMGGSLTARSDGPGRGATFVLELPAPELKPAT